MSSVGIPDTWVTNFDQTSFNLASKPPDPTAKEVTLTVSIPSNETSGEYSFEVIANSLGTSSSISLNLTVNAVYQVAISAIGPTEIESQAGKAEYFQFAVTNLGNTDDEVLITSTGTMISQGTPNNFGWSSQVLGSNIILTPRNLKTRLSFRN